MEKSRYQRLFVTESEIKNSLLQCSVEQKGLPAMPSKKVWLSKKMQNILLLNSENSIPRRVLGAHYKQLNPERELSLHSVLTELRILSKIQGGGEQGSQIYTIIERVQSESRGKARAKNESDALSIEISNFSTGSTSRVSTTPGDG